MQEKPLLLHSAKTGVMVEPHRGISPWWRRAAIALGLVVVIVGAADAATRLAQQFFGEDANFFTFAPAAAILDPSILGEVQGTSTVSFVPTRMVIPALGVDAAVESVGKKADGSMGTPSKLENLAWYARGSQPGSKGNAVFAGHVNNGLSLPGVFAKLYQLQRGAEVTVKDDTGRTLTYRVTERHIYDVDNAPLETIFATSGPSKIVLITCEGNWDPEQKTFDQRLVVVAELASS